MLAVADVIDGLRAGGDANPRKGELDWKPLRHHAVLRVLHNPHYAGAFVYGRYTHHAAAQR